MTALQEPHIDVNLEQPSSRSQRVLVVDDDPLLRRLLSDSLREAGFLVVEASNGREALDVLEREQCAIVLLDGQLPLLSGREVLRELRRNRRTATLPVILVTADDSIPDRVSGLAAGADDYVTKPFALEEVIARVHAALRAHEAWSETLAAHERHRRGLSKALAGAARQPTTEAAAAVMCNAIADQKGVLATSIVRITADGRPIVLATAGHTTASLDDSLPVRAGAGPWVERDPLRVFAPLEQFDGGRTAGVLVVELDGALIDAAAGLAAAIDCAAAISSQLLPRFVHEHRAEMDGAELRALLETGAFRSHFQPIVDLQEDRVVGVEALTRFADGSSPDVRFGEASALGLLIELELATLACAVSAARSLVPTSTWLSLNVSPELMLSAEYETVREVLDLRDRDVVLELSERQLVTDYDAVRTALRSAGDGIRWSIDDAGSGFASLRHILRLEPAFIKLDRSWVDTVDADTAKQAMIAGLCHFARQTGAQIIAEGIETPQECDALMEMGVTLGQGFLLGPPAPLSIRD